MKTRRPAGLRSGGYFLEKFLFAVDQGVDIGCRQLEAVAVRNGIGGAGFDAIAAKNAARIIDIVDSSVTLTCGNSLRIGIFRGLNIDAPRRASGGTQKTADTLFQSVFVAVQYVDSAVTRLEMDGLFGVIFGDWFPQHIAEGHAKAF